jgi:dihydropyrimidine dehydrogenase (NAD+) subunit PreA
MTRQDVDLQVEFAGLRFENPFLLASGSPTLTGEMIGRAFEHGWGGAVTKTLKPPSLRRNWLSREPQPMLAPIKHKGRNIGMQNIATSGGHMEMQDWQAQIPVVKDRYPEHIVIGSIAAAMEEDDWKWLTEGMLKAGVDAIELDASCSHASAQLVGGRLVGEVPELARRVTEWVKEVCDRPVVVKLPAFVPDFKAMVDACAEAGAAGVSGINTLPCLVGANLDTFAPLLSVRGRTAYGGLSGPAIKPVALRAVSLMAKAGTLPVSGIGGVTSWEDAAEFLLFGAMTVQVCTAVMWYGYGLVEKLITGLGDYLTEKNLGSASELVGRTNALVEPSIANLQTRSGLRAHVIQEKCRQCGRCVLACRDGGFQAIWEDSEGTAVVDPEHCDGCGLCLIVCRFEAIEWQQEMGDRC